MLLNKVLSIGNKKLCKKENNSLTNLFEQLCTIHMFINVIIVANFVQCAPSYKGTHASYRASKPSNTSSSSTHRSFGMWSSFSCPIFSCSLATTSTISQVHCTFPTMFRLVVGPNMAMGVFGFVSSVCNGWRWVYLKKPYANKFFTYMPSCNNPPTTWEMYILVVGPCFWEVDHIVTATHSSSKDSRSPRPFQHGRKDVFYVALGVFELLMWTPIAYNLCTLTKGKPWWSSHFGGLVATLSTTISRFVGPTLDGPKWIHVVGRPLAPHLDPLPYWAIMLL